MAEIKLLPAAITVFHVVIIGVSLLTQYALYLWRNKHFFQLNSLTYFTSDHTWRTKIFSAFPNHI